MGSYFSACTKAKSPLNAVPPSACSESKILESSKLKKFDLNDLELATGSFQPVNLLGEGGFGHVFKGWISEHSFEAASSNAGMVIAVKRLKQESHQGHKEWLAEINYLGQLHHPNLVKLVGYCLEDKHRMLVYEFMPLGSLDNYLFWSESRSSYFQPVSWDIRMRIALDAAKGLAYLHSPKAKVIYCDFKSSNILLDSNYNAKLSDFGLAKDGPANGESHVSTSVMGTLGYAAPAYLATGRLTAKCDVYSFGVVLLEMLSGRRVLDDGVHLVDWVKPFLQTRSTLLGVMDTRLGGNYSRVQAFKALHLANKCTGLQPRDRPNMHEAVEVLEQIVGGNTASVGAEGIGRQGRAGTDEASSSKAGSYPRPSAPVVT